MMCKCSHDYDYHVAKERDPFMGNRLTGREQCVHPMCNCQMFLHTPQDAEQRYAVEFAGERLPRVWPDE